MDRIQVKLRLMNGNSYSPSETNDFLLPGEGGIIEIYKNNRREAGCRPEPTENHGSSKVLARIHSMQESLFVEPLVDNVSIYAPFLHQDARGSSHAIPITHSTAYYNNYRTYAFLRPDDSIQFLDHDLAVAVMASDTGTTISNEPQASAKLMNNATERDEVIQVKSSNIVAEASQDQNATSHSNEDEVTDSEDEEDLDRSIWSARDVANRDATPPTVKETPANTRTYSTLNDDDQAYSTARDELVTESEDCAKDNDSVPDVESPSYRAKQRAETVHSQGRANLTSTQDQEDAAQSIDELPTSESPDTDTVVALKEGDAEQGAAVVTSDPLDPHEVFVKTAQQSLMRSGAKRKLEDVVEDDSEQQAGKKKSKLREDPQIGQVGTHDSGADKRVSLIEGGDTDSVSPQRVTDNSPIRLVPKDGPKPRRSNTRDKLKPRIKDVEDEVIIVKKPSPEVIVRKTPKGDSPQSSTITSSSSLTGKVPKILLSSDSTVHSNASIKRWLTKIGATIIRDVPSRGAHFICVVTKKHTLKSAKVLHSLAMGKLVVTDDWITDSKLVGELLDPAEYVHDTLEKDMTHDRSRLFVGKHLFFTAETVKNYKDGWIDIQNIAREAGATEVEKVEFSVHCLRDSEDILFFGSNQDDSGASRLIHEYGQKVYSKELFTHVIIHGELKVDSGEFLLKASVPSKGQSRR